MLLRKGTENSSEYFKAHLIFPSSTWEIKDPSMLTYQSKYFIWLFCHRGSQYTGEIKIAARKITMQGTLLEWTNWRNLNLFSLSYPMSLYNECLEFLVTNLNGLICINFKGSRTLHMVLKMQKCWDVWENLKNCKKSKESKKWSTAVDQDCFSLNFCLYWNPNQDRLHLSLSGSYDVIWEHVLLQPELRSMIHR